MWFFLYSHSLRVLSRLTPRKSAFVQHHNHCRHHHTYIHDYTQVEAKKVIPCRILQILSNRLEFFDETLQLLSLFILTYNWIQVQKRPKINIIDIITAAKFIEETSSCHNRILSVAILAPVGWISVLLYVAKVPVRVYDLRTFSIILCDLVDSVVHFGDGHTSMHQLELKWRPLYDLVYEHCFAAAGIGSEKEKINLALTPETKQCLLHVYTVYLYR